MSSPFSSTLEMSLSASLPNRFLRRTAAPVLVCSLPSKRSANASCSLSASGWPRNTTTAKRSMASRIDPSSAGLCTMRTSTPLTSAPKRSWSGQNEHCMHDLLEQRKHGRHRRGDHAYGEPAEHSQAPRNDERPHDGGFGCEEHHHRHDRNRH